VRNWLIGLGVAVACVVASWSLLVLLARRLSPGILRDLAGFIPDCVTTVRRLRKDPRVPRRAKVAIVFAGLWVASPIDLIPEFLPVIGPLDDVVVVALALRCAGRQVPREVLLAAWPGEPRLLERLLGPARSPPQTRHPPGEGLIGRLARVRVGRRQPANGTAPTANQPINGQRRARRLSHTRAPLLDNCVTVNIRAATRSPNRAVNTGSNNTPPSNPAAAAANHSVLTARRVRD